MSLLEVRPHAKVSNVINAELLSGAQFTNNDKNEENEDPDQNFEKSVESIGEADIELKLRIEAV